MNYIEGGTPLGSDVSYKGARSKTPPRADAPLVLSQALYFAAWSGRAWGGTSGAFITVEGGEPTTFARAYLIAPDQFEDVVRQENAHGPTSGELAIDIDGAKRSGHSQMVQNGYYTDLVYLGNRDGYPILSFRFSQNRTDHNPPSPAYLRVIHRGLLECHGLVVDDSVNYLTSKPGVLGKWTVEQVTEILTGPRWDVSHVVKRDSSVVTWENDHGEQITAAR